MQYEQDDFVTCMPTSDTEGQVRVTRGPGSQERASAVGGRQGEGRARGTGSLGDDAHELAVLESR